MTEMVPPHVVPTEGLAALHLFYRLDRARWEMLSPQEKKEAKAALQETVQEACRWEKFQIFTFAMLGKADIGWMILGPDVHALNALEKKIQYSLGPGVLSPVFTYLSLTERSEYTSTEESYREQLRQEEGIADDSPEMQEKISAFHERIEKYTQNRLYPQMPFWEYFCFYPMSKRRKPQQNWYGLDFATRKQLMTGHARVGRGYANRIKQLITGSTGLDDWEWGVSLFAHSPSDIKSVVYEMRFDQVSYDFAEFGPFYNGLTLSLPHIYERLML